MDRVVTCVRARTSDRTAGAGAGAEALARILGGRVVGDPPADPRPRDWAADPDDAAPALAAAASAVAGGLDAGALPVLTASDCTICLATLPEVARRVPGVRIAWFDAHGDFNTPDTTPSGFLGGMCLAAACGRWGDVPDPVDPRDVSFVGVRDLDPGEREEVEAAGVAHGLPADGPVYVHLDLDVLDPREMPSQFAVPGGMRVEDLRRALEALAPRLVGIEVTALEHPVYAPMAAGLVRAAAAR